VQGDPMSQINQTGRRIIYVMMVVVVLVVIWQILTPL
jgi:cell division protein FtsL